MILSHVKRLSHQMVMVEWNPRWLFSSLNSSCSLSAQSQCEPQSYRPMHHEDFKEDLRKFRLKSRTWAGERSKRDMYSRLKKLWAPPPRQTASETHCLPLNRLSTNSSQSPRPRPTNEEIPFGISPTEGDFIKSLMFHFTIAKLVIYAI